MPAIVVNTIGTGGDYTTLQTWEDDCPLPLVSLDQVWRGEVLNQEITGASGTLLTIAGQTTDATRYVELTAQAGASFADHADKATNPLRYNASVGAAIKNNAPYGTVIVVSTSHTRISRLQFSDSTVGPTRTLDVTGANSIIDQIIVDTNVASIIGGVNGIARNVFLLQDGGGNIAGIGNGGSILNCTLVRPSNFGAATHGIVNTYIAITIRNTAIFGATNFTSNSFTGNNNGSSGTIGWGSSNQASLTYADQFEEPSASSGAQDYRLKTGSALIDNGADLSGSGVTVDIVGTARAVPYDIGAWEVAGGSPDVTVALTGQAATFGQGSLGVARNTALTGQAATFGQGSVAPASSVAITGQAATFGQGSVAPAVAVGLAGQAATFGQGDVAPALSVGLTGQQATFGQGVLSIPGDVTVALTGQAATFGQGTITASTPVLLDTHDGYLRRSRRQRRIEALQQRAIEDRLADAQALRLALEAALGLAAEVPGEAPAAVAEAVERAPKPAEVDWQRVAADAETYDRMTRAVNRLVQQVQAEMRRLADEDDEEAAFLMGLV